MPQVVSTDSGWLRPWINETPADEGDPNKCVTKQWHCMTEDERQEYVDGRAKSVIEVVT